MKAYELLSKIDSRMYHVNIPAAPRGPSTRDWTGFIKGTICFH